MSIESNGWEFDTYDELEEALEGEWGQDAQFAARLAAVELQLAGRDDDGSEEYAEEHGTAEAQAFENEIARLEQRIGRTLTNKELERLVNAVPEDGPLPDLSEKYANELAGRGSQSADSRRALMLERAEDASAEAEAEDAESAAHLSPAGNRITGQDGE